MQTRIRTLFLLAASLLLASCVVQSPPPSSTQGSAPAPQGGKYSGNQIAVVSISNLSRLSGVRLNQHRGMDEKILARTRKQIQERGMEVAAMQTPQTKYVLAFAVEDVDCVANALCEGTTRIEISYVLKDRSGNVIKTGKAQERSTVGWQTAVNRLTETLAGEVTSAFFGAPAPAQAAPPVTTAPPPPAAPRGDGIVFFGSATKADGMPKGRAEQIRQIDKAFAAETMSDLKKRGISVAASGQGEHQYSLVYSLDKVDCGPKFQCNKQASLQASYILKDRSGNVLKKGAVDENSKKHGWDKAVDKMAKELAQAVAGALKKN